METALEYMNIDIDIQVIMMFHFFLKQIIENLLLAIAIKQTLTSSFLQKIRKFFLRPLPQVLNICFLRFKHLGSILYVTDCIPDEYKNSSQKVECN